MHSTIAIAGTFDRLHKGHEFFISRSFGFGKKVIVGLTSDEYALKKSKVKSQNLKIQFKIQNYQKRKEHLKKFLKKNSLLKRAEIVKIDDIYGPAKKNSHIQALIVTSETLKGARQVNQKRRKDGFKPLKIIKIPLILAEDRKKISSTRVRMGEINRLGIVFSKHQVFGRQIIQDLRLALKSPLGELIKGNPEDPGRISQKVQQAITSHDPTILCTVGDVATSLCNYLNLPINLAIVDYKVNRKKRYKKLSQLGFPEVFDNKSTRRGVVRVKNPPGHMTSSLVQAVKKSIGKVIEKGTLQIVRVIGEEDLAGVPAILFAPLSSIVLYGQPGKGIVLVKVTEKKKSDLLKLVDKHS